MRQFIIHEVAEYEVEATTPEDALRKFIEGDIRKFHCNVTDREVVEQHFSSYSGRCTCGAPWCATCLDCTTQGCVCGLTVRA